MSAINLEDFVTQDMVRRIFEDYIMGEDKGWAMSICGRILTVNGKMLFNTREQAVRAFYNSYHWIAMREMHLAAHPNAERYSWWTATDRGLYWKAFKKVLERDYGLKFFKV